MVGYCLFQVIRVHHYGPKQTFNLQGDGVQEVLLRQTLIANGSPVGECMYLGPLVPRLRIRASKGQTICKTGNGQSMSGFRKSVKGGSCKLFLAVSYDITSPCLFRPIRFCFIMVC